jgi:hypothetical protein
MWDFGDVRFTDNDEQTLLDYWIEEKTLGSYAVFWVEVQDDLSSSNAEIYVYYGNNYAPTTSDGSATFVEYEDFNGPTQSMTLYNEDSSLIEITHDTNYNRLKCEYKSSSTLVYKTSTASLGSVSVGHALRTRYYRQTPTDYMANKHYLMYMGEDYTEYYPASSTDDMAGHCVWSALTTWPPTRSYDWAHNGANSERSDEYHISR